MAVMTDEQTMLRDMARGWLRDRLPVAAYRDVASGKFPLGYDPAAYAEIAEMGWTGIAIGEEHGGSAFGYRGFGLILEEMGRTLAASPLLGAGLASASALRLAGSSTQQDKWLPRIVAGAVVALAVDEDAPHAPAAIAMSATPDGDGWRLDGMKRPVKDGVAADLFVVAARSSGKPGDSGGISLLLVERSTPGLRVEPLDQIDGPGWAMLRFDEVVLGPDALIGEAGNGGALLDQILDIARIGLAAEMLGMAKQAFDMTLDYLKTRVQFDRPIGSFQALQHRAAFMFSELQPAQSAVEAALAALDDDSGDVRRLASLAKALVGEALHRVANEMIQMHGGIGMTEEHDAGLFFKRARVANQTFGSVSFHRERWARLGGY